MLIISMLMSFSAGAATQVPFLGKGMAVMSMAVLIFSVVWYYAFGPRLRAAAYKGRVSIVVRVLDVVLAPILVAQFGFIIYSMVGHPNGWRQMVFVTLSILWTLSVVIGLLMLRDRSQEDGGVFWSGDSDSLHPAPPKRVVTRAVMVEGNICAGKSDLCKVAIHRAPDRVQMRDENVHAALLAAFNEDPSKYGFALQLAMTERRNAVLDGTLQSCTKEFFCIDRSSLGSFAMLVTNFILGSITDADFVVMRTEYGNTPALALTRALANYKGPAVVCFVCTPASECKRRLGKRPGVDQGTTIEYLTAVAIGHYICIASVLTEPDWDERVPVHMLDGSKRRSSRSDIGQFLKQASQKQHTIAPGLDRLYENLENEQCAMNFLDDDAQEARYNQVLELLDIDDIKPEVPSEKAWHAAVLKLIKKKR